MERVSAFITRDTVDGCTFARAATSLILTFRFTIFTVSLQESELQLAEGCQGQFTRCPRSLQKIALMLSDQIHDQRNFHKNEYRQQDTVEKSMRNYARQADADLSK